MMHATHQLALAALYWVAGWIIFLEGLNKLERTDAFRPDATPAQRLVSLVLVFAPWRWTRRTVVAVLKLWAWALLVIGAAGAIVSPFVAAPPPLRDVAVACGFALLIVRSRLKEG